jgi:hypothetical protein
MLRNALIGMILLGGTSGVLGNGQTTTTTQPIMHPHGGPHNVVDPTGSDNTPMSSLQEQQAILRDKERQQKLMTDTNKLLELATDLKTQVDKTNRGIMSVDVIKKAEEIEKLARNVKERMKG